MKAKTFHVFGLGFGDEGKGSIVDSLVRKYEAVAVIRYNGGPQAAHHVVDADRIHCFSQFGSGTLTPDVKTHLSGGMLVKPQSLLVEAERLQQIGVSDALQRITISPECFLVTPLHALVGQMLEASRGMDAHGSVGMGVGQASFDRLAKPKTALQVRDLLDGTNLKSKITAHYLSKLEQATSILEENASSEEVASIFETFLARMSPTQLLEEYQQFVGLLAGSFQSDEVILEQLSHQGTVVLEGAQGVLLDPRVGFQPHVTKTTVLPSEASHVASLLGAIESVTNIGVIRAFSTRHGAGPFVTAENLESLSIGEYNKQNRWQGDFRYGWLDLVALRYSVQSSVGIDALAVTCIDRLEGQQPIKVCNSYEYLGVASDRLDEYFIWDNTSGKIRVTGIKPISEASSARSVERTRMFNKCRPLDFIEFQGWPSVADGKSTLHKNVWDFLNYLQSNEGLGVPVAIASLGASADDKHHLLDN